MDEKQRKKMEERRMMMEETEKILEECRQMRTEILEKQKALRHKMDKTDKFLLSLLKRSKLSHGDR